MGTAAKKVGFESAVDLEQSGMRPIPVPRESGVFDAKTWEAEHQPRFTSIMRKKQVEGPVFDRGVDCFGVPVAIATWNELRSWFFDSVQTRARDPRVVYFANAHTLNLAWKDSELRAILGRADVVLNDGIGVDIYSRIAGTRFAENFNGTDLLPRLFASADPSRPLRVFLYGAKKGRAEKAAKNIEARFPGVKVVGTMDGYTRSSVIETINEACPDVVLVGMGNPIQEKWIDENKSLLDVGVVMGIGALIDFLSGEVERAPSWVRSARLEWAYRLLREPKRLFARYVLGNPAFLVRSFLYLGFGVKPA